MNSFLAIDLISVVHMTTKNRPSGRVLILSLGSRGNVQPYIALSKAFIKDDHQVTICTSSTLEDFITQQGVGYGYMNNEILKLIDSDAGRDALEDSGNMLGWSER